MISVDQSDFNAALREWADSAGKDSAEACNVGAKTLIINTAKETKKTLRGRIKADMEAVVQSRRGPGKRKYVLSAKKGMTRDEMGIAAEKKLRARQRGAGYIQLAVKLAGKAFGLYKNLRAGHGWAADSTGKTATASGFTAEATLTVALPSGAEKHVSLEAALPAATEKVLEFAARNLARNAERLSAR